MSPPCAIEACKRKSRALCHCCNKNLCPDHLKEHDESINSQINPLADELNSAADQLLKININDVIRNCREKLDKGRDDCHMIIDRFYDEKCQELQQRCVERVDKQREDIDRIKSKTNELIREQEATLEDIPHLKASINDIKRDVNQFEKNGIIVDVHPLTIIKDLVYIEEWTPTELDTSNFLLPCRTINCSDKDESILTSNSRYLLLHLNLNLCLFDRDLTLIKQIPSEYDRIADMCWSSTLNSFIIIAEKNGVFLINENLASVERIETIQQKQWLSCTCSDASLFLTTSEFMNSNIFEFSILSSFRLIKQWTSTKTCDLDEKINDIVYNKGTLALLISQGWEKTLKLDLRSSVTLDSLWSLPLNITHSTGQLVNRLCLIKCDEWIVTDHNNSRLFHISKDGKAKVTQAYQSIPLNAVLFGSNILVIRTTKDVHFHRV
jgi:hypothetical protein